VSQVSDAPATAIFADGNAHRESHPRCCFHATSPLNCRSGKMFFSRKLHRWMDRKKRTATIRPGSIF
jgi:hypothetical protein